MFRNDYSFDQQWAQDRAVNTKEHLSNMSPSEIVDEMENIFLDNPSDDMDVDQLITYLEHLDQVAPVDAPFNAEESYQDFIENHSVLMETSTVQKVTQPRYYAKTLMRRAVLVAATLCAVLVVCTFAYATSTPFAQWVNETFSFGGNPSQGYRSLQEALDDYGIRDNLIPAWLPPEYVINDVYVSESDSYTIFGALYQSIDANGDMLLITIKQYDVQPNTSFEKDGIDVKTVLNKNSTYYVSNNNGKTVILWRVDCYECCVSGNYDEEDIYQIINSIG